MAMETPAPFQGEERGGAEDGRGGGAGGVPRGQRQGGAIRTVPPSTVTGRALEGPLVV